MATDDDAWEEAWQRKAEGREVFAQAELVEDHTFRRWNGHESIPEYTEYVVKAGGTIIVTTVSRFGHACIRGTDVDNEVHGYDSTIDPSGLRCLRFLSDGGRPWRKVLLERIGVRKGGGATP